MSFSYTTNTKKNIEQVIEELESNLKEIGFGVLGILNFKDILEKKGLEFQEEYRLMEVCNPHLAKQVLESNPDLGLLLPCTIAVYRKNNENYIGLAKPTSLLAMASEENLQFVGEEIESNLIKVIEKIR